MKKTILVAALFVASTAVAATAFHPRATQQPGGGFSVDLPIIRRVRGATTTFTTALDITNNSPQQTDVKYSSARGWIRTAFRIARDSLRVRQSSFR